MHSLRRQLTLGSLLALTLLIGGGGLATYWAMRDTLYDQFDEALRVKALMVITATEQYENRIRVDFSDRFLREFDREVATDFFQVFDGAGEHLTRSDSLNRQDLPNRYGSLVSPLYWDLQLPNGQPGRAIGIQFPPKIENRRGHRQETPSIATVVVASDRRNLDATVAELRLILGATGLGLLALTAIVMPLVLRRGLRPLDHVAGRASQIDAHSLTERFPESGLPAELRPITGRLNDLLARLEASFERERRFSANLAHELRTPLAELRSQAELALKWPEERTPEADRAILEITLQMEALVGHLLALSRAEQGAPSLNRESVKVTTVVDALLTPLALEIARRNLTLAVDVPDAAALETEPVLFRSIAGNLLENAVAYAPVGGTVHVRFTGKDGQFCFEVANPTHNLKTEDLPKLLEPFWRKDPARTGNNHAGLGLALACSLAAQLGFTLEPDLGNDGVLVMRLAGPVRPAVPKGITSSG